MDSGDPAGLRLEMLKAHLERSDTSIRAYDDHLYKIKGFAVTACSAATLFALQQKQAAMFIVAALAAVGFWILDANTKTIQRKFIDRSESIEKFFRDADLDHSAADEALRQMRQLLTIPEAFAASGGGSRFAALAKEMRRPGTYYLYVSIVVLVAGIATVIELAK
jgi:hypothetical protein